MTKRMTSLSLPIVFLLFAPMSDVRAATPMDIHMSVASEGNNGDVALKINLTYFGKQQLKIYKSDLPWGIKSRMILEALCLNGQKTPIPSVEYIDDPSPELVDISPGQTLEGLVKLAPRFPALAGCLTQKDALIFWSYQFAPLSNEPSERLSGGIVIPANPRLRP